jgi:hypothetical protein
MCETNFFLSTLLSSVWVVLGTWLHVVGAPQKLRKNEIKTRFEQIFTIGSYAKPHHGLICSELGVLRTLVKYVVPLSKRKN